MQFECPTHPVGARSFTLHWHEVWSPADCSRLQHCAAVQFYYVYVLFAQRRTKSHVRFSIRKKFS